MREPSPPPHPPTPSPRGSCGERKRGRKKGMVSPDGLPSAGVGPENCVRGCASHAAAMLLVLCTVLPLAGCTSVEDDPSYLRVTLTASPRDLDPRLGGDEVSQRIQQLVFSSLFVLDSRLRVVPDVATGIESPDPLTYIVHLRRGVTFHDGSPFTSADVVYTYRSFLDPAFISAKR